MHVIVHVSTIVSAAVYTPYITAKCILRQLHLLVEQLPLHLQDMISNNSLGAGGKSVSTGTHCPLISDHPQGVDGTFGINPLLLL